MGPVETAPLTSQERVNWLQTGISVKEDWRTLPTHSMIGRRMGPEELWLYHHSWSIQVPYSKKFSGPKIFANGSPNYNNKFHELPRLTFILCFITVTEFEHNNLPSMHKKILGLEIF